MWSHPPRCFEIWGCRQCRDACWRHHRCQIPVQTGQLDWVRGGATMSAWASASLLRHGCLNRRWFDVICDVYVWWGIEGGGGEAWDLVGTFQRVKLQLKRPNLHQKCLLRSCPWICLPPTHHANMPLMHYVCVTRHGRIIVLQSETPTHIIAASTTTEQDVGSNRNYCWTGRFWIYLLGVKVYKGEYQSKVLRHWKV